MAGWERQRNGKTESEEPQMTQANQILSALKRGEKLTPLMALQRYGCFRLAARIQDLRDSGVPVITSMVKVGESRVARYSL